VILLEANASNLREPPMRAHAEQEPMQLQQEQRRSLQPTAHLKQTDIYLARLQLARLVHYHYHPANVEILERGDMFCYVMLMQQRHSSIIAFACRCGLRLACYNGENVQEQQHPEARARPCSAM